MTSGMFSGFVCGAFLGIIGLAAWSQMSPLPPGPAPVIEMEAPVRGHVPATEAPPDIPGAQSAP